MKKYLLIFQLLICAIGLSAQRLVVNAPSHVSVGENFRLTYTVNSQNIKDFHVGNIPHALEIITGPYVSQQSSIQVINGHTSSSSSVTYTFILCATQNGTYHITPAHVVTNGKRLSSAAITVNVTGSNKNATGSPRMHEDGANQGRLQAAGSKISNADLFIKVSANKRRVYEQEPILLTYKVYTLVDLSQLEGKMPDLNGFHTQEIPLPQQKSFHIERVNGRPYRCVTWSQYVMYPQMTGKLEIPSIVFNGTVVQQNRNVDPFEAFFNGGSGYVEVKKAIKAPSISIQVDPLPTRPAGFSGGVGKFGISAQLNKKEVRTNDPITIRVVVSGIGNLKLIKQPILNLPKDFDKYDAKITDKTRLTSSGIEGNMIYDFMVVPRNKGVYIIPPIQFIYYDIALKSYKTLKTQSLKLNVLKGNNASNDEVDYSDFKNQDIKPINVNLAVKYQQLSDIFYGSFSYYILLVLLIILTACLFIIFRKRAAYNANVDKYRGKKAKNLATKRLQNADKLMLSNEKESFYDEVLRALLGYMSDKLSISVEELNKDNINKTLLAHGIDKLTVERFIKVLDDCEFNRYAPGEDKGNMNATFDAAMSVIIEIENVMKSNKKHKRSLALILFFALMMTLPSLTMKAVTKKNADDEYIRGNYQQAIKDYEDLLKKGSSSMLYYNLGNAYYRTDNMPLAVLNYERAQLLEPNNSDVRYNLQLARSKTIDKLSQKNEMFFVTLYRFLLNLQDVNGWAIFSIISLVVALLLLFGYLSAPKFKLRKISFYGMSIFFFLFLISTCFAHIQKNALILRTGAIVMDFSATLRKMPVANSASVGIIHEGSKVTIKDDTMKDWKYVELSDGRVGWIQSSKIERI